MLPTVTAQLNTSHTRHMWQILLKHGPGTALIQRYGMHLQHMNEYTGWSLKQPQIRKSIDNMSLAWVTLSVYLTVHEWLGLRFHHQSWQWTVTSRVYSVLNCGATIAAVRHLTPDNWLIYLARVMCAATMKILLVYAKIHTVVLTK